MTKRAPESCLAEVIRQAKAEAWLEGWAAPEDYPLERNPYLNPED